MGSPYKPLGIILLRLKDERAENKVKMVSHIIKKYRKTIPGSILVASEKKIRIRIELEIDESLHKRQPYNKIAKLLRVSAKTIAKVRRLIDSNVISFDENGNAFYTGKTISIKPEKAELEGFEPLVYGLMHILGAENPKDGLEQTCN